MSCQCILKVIEGRLETISRNYNHILQVVDSVKGSKNVIAHMFANENGGKICEDKHGSRVLFENDGEYAVHTFHQHVQKRKFHLGKTWQEEKQRDHVYNTMFKSLSVLRSLKRRKIKLLFCIYGDDVIKSPLDVVTLCTQGLMKSLYQPKEIFKYDEIAIHVNTREQRELLEHHLSICGTKLGISVIDGIMTFHNMDEVCKVHNELQCPGISKGYRMREKLLYHTVFAYQDKNIVQAYQEEFPPVSQVEKAVSRRVPILMHLSVKEKITILHDIETVCHELTSRNMPLEEKDILEIRTIGEQIDYGVMFVSILKLIDNVRTPVRTLLIDPVIIEVFKMDYRNHYCHLIEDIQKAKGRIVFPVYDKQHFLVIEVNFASRIIRIYDSICQHDSDEIVSIIKDFIKTMHLRTERVIVPQQYGDYGGNTCCYHCVCNTLDVLKDTPIPMERDIYMCRKEMLNLWNIDGGVIDPFQRPFMFSRNQNVQPMEVDELADTEEKKSLSTLEEKMEIDEESPQEMLQKTMKQHTEGEIRRKRWQKKKIVHTIVVNLEGEVWLLTRECFVPAGYNYETRCKLCHSFRYVTTTKGECCACGKNVMPERELPPKLLFKLGSDVHPKSPHFKRNIVLYNTLLSFASLAKHSVSLGPHGVQPAKVQGPIYTFLSQLYSRNPEKCSFGSVYTMNAMDASFQRWTNANRIGADVDKELMENLSKMMEEFNVFALAYRSYHEVVEQYKREKKTPGCLTMRILSRYEINRSMTETNPGCFNLPENSDIVSVIFDNNTGERIFPDYRSHPKYSRMQMWKKKVRGELPRGSTIYQYTRNPNDGIPQMPIPHWAPEADPMAFSLMSPFGEYFYHKGIKKHPVGTSSDIFDEDQDSIRFLRKDLSNYPRDSKRKLMYKMRKEAEKEERRQQLLQKRTATDSKPVEVEEMDTNLEKESEEDTSVEGGDPNLEKESEEKEADLMDALMILQRSDSFEDSNDGLNMQQHIFEDVGGERLPVPHHRIDVDAIMESDSDDSLTEESDEPISDIESVHDAHDLTDEKEDVESKEADEKLMEAVTRSVSGVEESSGQKETKEEKDPKNLSLREFFVYLMQCRPWNLEHGFHPIFSFGKLGQILLIHQYMKTVDNAVSFASRKRIRKLSAEKNRLFEYIAEAGKRHNIKIGTISTLPFNFPESPQWYKTLFEDTIAVMNEVGPPDLFITYTANPEQEEIKKNMFGKKWEDNPVLIAQSFNARVKELLNDLMGEVGRDGKRPMKGIFGRVKSFVYSTEFQARGLPHIHLLLTLHDEDKLNTPEKVNMHMKGEIPRETDDMTDEERLLIRRLKDIVIKRMQHTACQNNKNVKCMQTVKPHHNTCNKRFPKDFRNETSITEDGYAQLMRRDFDERNRWTVSYNPYLLLKYDSHINVEHVASVKSIKYIFKYIFKGVDKVLTEMVDTLYNENKKKTKKITVLDHILLPKEAVSRMSDGVKRRINEHAKKMLQDAGLPLVVDGQPVVAYDEGAIFKECRSVTACEAAWRLLSYKLHDSSHNVETLFVHEEHKEKIVYDDMNTASEIQKLIDEHVTKLQGYFTLMENNKESGEPLLPYLQVPKKYRFVNKKWQKRKYDKENRTLGYIRAVRPKFQELFSLRELAKVVPATCFQDYMKDGTKHFKNFTEAARARRLIDGETEWEQAMEEVSNREYPQVVRMVFSQILVFGNPKKPLDLYNKFKEQMFDNKRMEDRYKEARTLRHIESYLQMHDRSLSNYELPEVNRNDLEESVLVCHEEYDDETVEAQFDTEDSRRIAAEMRQKMTDEQRTAADKIMETIRSPETSSHRCIFLEGSGGTGKTFLYKYLYHQINAEGINEECGGNAVEMVAHTGVAATLLINGTTVHRRYGLPIELDENSHSFIDVDIRRKRARQLRKLRVIMWDEATMSSWMMFSCIDELLQKIRGNKRPFGGVVVVCGGDWKQLLPVSRRGGPVEAKDLCLKKSKYWQFFTTLKLTKNIRAQSDPDYCMFLEQVGAGKNEVAEGNSYRVEIPAEMIVGSVEEMIQDLFGKGKLKTPYNIRNSALLTVLNKDALELNDKILSLLPTAERTYTSMDMPIEQRCLSTLPPETFYSQTPSGMPPHKLRVRKGCIVTLLKNFNVKRGLCNGTKLVVKALYDDVIVCETLPEDRTEIPMRVPLFRIPILSTEKGNEFQFQRTQFPIRLGYALTINKSQGQTLEKVGIMLSNPVFAHGHLYVALSRARNHKDVKIYTGMPLDENDYGEEIASIPNIVLTDIVTD